MLYVVRFEDEPDRAVMRERHMEDHLRFLDRHRGRIQAAGPLHDVEADRPAGGLWLVDAPDVETVRALVEEDPFWPTGLRRSVRILAWRQVFVAAAGA